MEMVYSALPNFVIVNYLSVVQEFCTVLYQILRMWKTVSWLGLKIVLGLYCFLIVIVRYQISYLSFELKAQ